MKMVKSLLLGGAAALAVTATASAADLPVKAKPVQYVKICSLYGAGFYYIPGTDICLKIGGWTRFEYAYGSNGSFAWGPFNNVANNRMTNNSVFRARGYITADARSQTAYGTVRSYMAIGLSENDVGLNTAANTFSANRAFIQWAGFTFGRASSFYDFYSVPASSLWGAFPASDTGDPGWMVAAYTAQFGGGFSATLSLEQRRMTQIIGNRANQVAFPPGPATFAVANGSLTTYGASGNYGGFQVPDIVANLRIDQAWGSAQVMGALHHVNATYYGFNGATGAPLAGTGGPGDKWGYAVGAGIKLNAPMIGAGDYFQAQVNFTEGASRYVFSTPNSNWRSSNGANTAFGVLSDAVYGGGVGGVAGTGLELTKAWGFNAAYDHRWNPGWKTSLYGGYAAVRYNGQANAMLCAGTTLGNTAVAPVGCDHNWSTWWLGSRTQWNVSKDFYFAVDVLYSKLQSAQLTAAGTAATFGAGTTISDQDNWAFRFRVHRDFMP